MILNSAHTPPLGYSVLTPFYDRAIALLTRERRWRQLVIEQLGARPGETIMDIGCGTGRQAIAVTAIEPRCNYLGIDPDSDAISIARRKAAYAGSPATFKVARLDDLPSSARRCADKIVSSLVLHQVPLAEKRRLLRAMFNWLKPSGLLLIADYGFQPGIAMRTAFRLTVQLLDGKRDTLPNANGILPELIREAGFHDARELGGINTVTGRIELLGAAKPGPKRRPR